MKHFSVFFIKELKEGWRSFKFLWMPLVFLLLGITDPLVNYFMDDILGTVGNMPEGFEILMPELSPADLLLASTSQFQTIGVIVLVAIFAGAISRERQFGTATLLYVRPISYSAYFLSKWTVASLIVVLCAVAGYVGNIYYTAQLFGGVDTGRFFAMLATYCVWLLFVVAVTLAMSATFKTALAATLAILIVPGGLIVDAIVGSFWTMTPWKLGTYGVQIVKGEIVWKDYYGSLIITIALTVVFIVIGIMMSKRNAATTKI